MTSRTRGLGVALLLGLGILAPARLGAVPPESLRLTTLESHGGVTVTLDTSRFRRERVAVIRIVNRLAVAIEGRIPACDTVFRPANPAFSALRPAESGPFVIGPRQTVLIARPFRLVEPAKRGPDGTTYALDDDLDAEAGCRN